MKRIALLTVLLLVVGLSFGFAQAFTPAIAWSTAGTATLTWGVNLDTMETGFTNGGSAQWTLTLVPAVTLAKGAEAPVYGWIQLATTALTLSDTAGFASGATAVTAKIVAGPIQIGINGAPTLANGKTAVIESAADSVLEAETTLAGTAFSGPGTWIGYVSAPISIYAKIAGSDALNWGRPEDTEMNYNFGVDGVLAFAPVDLGFGFYTSLVTGAVPIGYVTAGLKVAPIALSVAADFNLDTAVAFDVSAAIGLTLDKIATVSVSVGYGDNFSGLDAKVALGLTAVPNLTESLTVWILDIASPTVGQEMEYKVTNSLSYKVALSDTTSITPAVDVLYGWNYETDDTIFTATASVAMALIPNTTITLKYASGDFIVVAPAVASLGAVTCAITVAY